MTALLIVVVLSLTAAWARWDSHHQDERMRDIYRRYGLGEYAGK